VRLSLQVAKGARRRAHRDAATASKKVVGTTRFARTLHFAETRLITIVLTYWDSLMFDLDAGARAPHITAS